MVQNPSNSSNLKQLALKGLKVKAKALSTKAKAK